MIENETATQIGRAPTEFSATASGSNYDAKANRCYVEITLRKKWGKQKENEEEVWQVYDGQTDDVLAYAAIENGKKVGMVFDPDVNRREGWDDANAYMDARMHQQR